MRTVILSLLITLYICGCSGGGNNILNPDEPPVKGAGQSSRTLWGIWQFQANPDAQTLEITTLRTGEFHLNALPFLEPPPLVKLTLESLEFNGNIIEADIGLRHPFLGQKAYTGFDVCGIIFTHGSVTGFDDPEIIMVSYGDTRLLNADGYTRWWNPAEFPHGGTIFSYIDGLLGTPADSADFNCTVNGYKYFADNLEKDMPLTSLEPTHRGVFSVGVKNIRHYTIDMAGGLIFNYAIDACWKMPYSGPPYDVPDDFPPDANRSEAWNINVTLLKNNLYYEESTGSAGGDLELLIDVWDHFDAGLNEVYAESLAGLPLTAALDPIGGGDGYSTYAIDITGENLTQNGKADLLITVRSEATGYGGILPDKPICAYYRHTFNIKTHKPLGWARTWGGGSWDEGSGVTTDGSGNVYVTGYFKGKVDFNPAGGDQHKSDIEDDVFLSKFDSAGNFEWARTWGGIDWDWGKGVTTDSSENVYVTGLFQDTVDFNPDGGDPHTSNGWWDVFLSKFDSSGNFVWARTWGGLKDERSFGVTTDSLGNVYITGEFRGTADFNPAGGDQHTSNGYYDAFLSKFDSSGNFVWARTWGGLGFECGSAITTGNSGNVYVTGCFKGTADFNPPGGDLHTSNGEDDVFLSKFDSSGNFVWTRTWGGEEHDEGLGVTTDSTGNVYVTGGFMCTVDFNPTGGNPGTSNGNTDIFLSKFNSSGDFQGVYTWGGERWDYGFGVTTDGLGNLYVTGYFHKTVDFNPGPGVDWHTCNSFYEDIFLSKFDLSGNFKWARTWGGVDGDQGYGVTTDNTGNIFVTGYFEDTVDFDPGPGVDTHASNGNEDVFLSKFPPGGNW